MSNKLGFKSAEHSMNYQVKVVSNKNRKQPVKFFSREEAEKLAASMGLKVSENFKVKEVKEKKTTTNEVEIVVNDIPKHLQKLLRG